MKVCAQPGCPELTDKGSHCETHKPAPWGGQDGGHQRKLGKSGSRRQRENRRTMRLHRGICHWCGKPGADEVDHVIPIAEGGIDDESNRAPIHGRPCHMQKLQEEAARARRRRRSASR